MSEDTSADMSGDTSDRTERAVRQLAEVIDGHRWSELAEVLHPDFTCRLVHTGEVFDRDAWVRLNAEYPGFQSFTLEDAVVQGDRAATRGRVRGGASGADEEFAVAGFVTVLDGRVRELVEVWADVGVARPEGTRPG